MLYFLLFPREMQWDRSEWVQAGFWFLVLNLDAAILMLCFHT